MARFAARTVRSRAGGEGWLESDSPRAEAAGGLLGRTPASCRLSACTLVPAQISLLAGGVPILSPDTLTLPAPSLPAAHFGIHEEMLKDTVRTKTYQQAIYQARSGPPGRQQPRPARAQPGPPPLQHPASAGHPPAPPAERLHVQGQGRPRRRLRHGHPLPLRSEGALRPDVPSPPLNPPGPRRPIRPLPTPPAVRASPGRSTCTPWSAATSPTRPGRSSPSTVRGQADVSSQPLLLPRVPAVTSLRPSASAQDTRTR